MILYGLKNCDTCRAALKALSVEKDVDFVDVRAMPLDPETLGRFLDRFGEALVNRRSTTWRGLSAEERAKAPEALLSAHPALMKRPVIDDGGALHLGWTPDVRASLLGSGKAVD